MRARAQANVVWFPMAEPISHDPAALNRDRKSFVVALTRRDESAFRVFVEENQRAVFAVISRIVGSGMSALVEDLAQETFLRAYRALPEFDPSGPAKVSTWLLTIASRLAIDEKRRRVPPRTDDEYALERAPALSPSPETQVENDQLRERIERAASLLPADQRAALVLAEYHGFSMEEVAAALDVPVATAKTKLFRARDRMRALLDAWRSS